MDKELNRTTEKKLGLNGLLVVVALMVLYALSCTVVKSWQIYTDEFTGVIHLCVSSLVISAIWLFMYWFLDRLQHESVKITLLSFLLGVLAYVSTKNIVCWFIADEAAAFFDNVAFPVFSFFVVFVFVVVRFSSFDELVDSFIYGGFVGTGIAFAACMSEFVKYESLDGQFLIIELITRLSVYAAICSLAGFLIHQSLLRKKTLKLILTVIAMIILFTMDYLVEQVLISNVAYANISILPVLISALFAIVLVCIVVFLVRRTLRKENIESLELSKMKSPFVILVIFILFFLVFALSIRYDMYRTEKFNSADNKWSFELPKGFVSVEEKNSDSIFNFDVPTGKIFYKNATGSINLYVFYDGDKAVEEIFSDVETAINNFAVQNPVNGWNVSVLHNQFVTQDSDSNDFILYQTTYSVFKTDKDEKLENKILVDVFSDKKNDKEVEKTVRTLIRTLEAKND